MATYRDRSREQAFMLPVHLGDQLQPGTFEHTIDYLVDNEIDLSILESRYDNDEAGAPAYDPAVLLEVVLFAYSRGITSSRRIARACEENVVFMSLSADSRPHFTTIAEFISSNCAKGSTIPPPGHTSCANGPTEDHGRTETADRS